MVPLEGDTILGDAADAGVPKFFGLPQWGASHNPARVAFIREVAEEYAHDPRMRWYTARILSQEGIEARDYPAMARAILRHVQRTVYYTQEKGEQLQSPWRTLQAKNGDCFAEGTLLLRDDMELVPVEGIRAGDRIWGRDRWSVVERQWSKGKLPVTEVVLNNGSTFRVTEDHKVYVLACKGPREGGRKAHGPLCAQDSAKWKQCCARHGSEIVRIHVSELQPGMEILQPEKIDRPLSSRWSVEESWLYGAYIAEGWDETNRVFISGKDGHWKETTKHRAQRYAEQRGWNTRWHAKYLAINSRDAAIDLMRCGRGALNKQIPEDALAKADLVALDEGLKLDASQNTHGEGWTFGTVSEKLAVQYRILQRMLGRSTSWKKVEDHGGFGGNPIYRVGVRAGQKRLQVKEIRRNVEEVEVYDITTDDHYVYLPEADCTVSNCDDMAILLYAMAESVGLPARMAIAGMDKQRRPLRWIEGEPFKHGDYSHIYVVLGWPPGRPSHWVSAEPTMFVPLGYDVTLHGIDFDHHGRPSPRPVTLGPDGIAQVPLDAAGTSMGGQAFSGFSGPLPASGISWLKWGLAAGLAYYTWKRS